MDERKHSNATCCYGTLLPLVQVTGYIWRKGNRNWRRNAMKKTYRQRCGKNIFAGTKACCKGQILSPSGDYQKGFIPFISFSEAHVLEQWQSRFSMRSSLLSMSLAVGLPYPGWPQTPMSSFWGDLAGLISAWRFKCQTWRNSATFLTLWEEKSALPNSLYCSFYTACFTSAQLFYTVIYIRNISGS